MGLFFKSREWRATQNVRDTSDRKAGNPKEIIDFIAIPSSSPFTLTFKGICVSGDSKIKLLINAYKSKTTEAQKG